MRITLRKKCPYLELFWSAFFPHFLAFGLNTERYLISPYSVQMRENSGKMSTRITPNTDTFYAVLNYRVLKVSKKRNALCCISSSMSLEKGRTVMKAFIESQFNYCPLIWILHSRTLKNKINRIYERALRTVHSDDNSSFNELLDKDVKMAPLQFIKEMSKV